jgi:hypothetical protein
LIVFLVSGATYGIHAEILIKPDDANINYYGRFDMSNAPNSVRFNWPGSIIEAVFTGSSIGVELDDGGGSYFNVEIDGEVVDTITPSSATRRMIKTDLSSGTDHSVRIILRTNGKDCSFGGFYLADGNALADKPEKPTRKMEFIGYSWAAGNVVGSTTSNDLRYFNACLTYARMTSKAFHAQDILVARGGCGLANGYGATMENRYPQTLCDVAGAWDFSSWIPDVVVMFLGINDFNNGTNDGDFISAYKRLITTVRNNYTDVPIVLIGLDENQNGHNILNNTREVADSFSDILTFSSPVRLGNATALWQHPTPSQHRQISDALIPVITEATGWDTVPPVGTTGRQPRKNVSCRRQYACAPVKTVQNVVMLPIEMTGIRKKVVAYDCRGRLVQSIVTSERKIMVREDLGLLPGMYLISVQRMQ